MVPSSEGPKRPSRKCRVPASPPCTSLSFLASFLIRSGLWPPPRPARLLNELCRASGFDDVRFPCYEIPHRHEHFRGSTLEFLCNGERLVIGPPLLDGLPVLPDGKADHVRLGCHFLHGYAPTWRAWHLPRRCSHMTLDPVRIGREKHLSTLGRIRRTVTTPARRARSHSFGLIELSQTLRPNHLSPAQRTPHAFIGPLSSGALSIGCMMLMNRLPVPGREPNEVEICALAIGLGLVLRRGGACPTDRRRAHTIRPEREHGPPPFAAVGRLRHAPHPSNRDLALPGHALGLDRLSVFSTRSEPSQLNVGGHHA